MPLAKPHFYLLTVARNCSDDLTLDQIADIEAELNTIAEDLRVRYRAVFDFTKQDNDDFKWIPYGEFVPKCSKKKHSNPYERRKGYCNRKKQPIFVASLSNVLRSIDLQYILGIVPNGTKWGTVKDKSELIAAICGLKRDENNKIHMSRLAQCIQSFYSPKLGTWSNKMLILLWQRIKDYREVLLK